MRKPASNDEIGPDTNVGASEVGLRRASAVIRWSIVGSAAVALILLYALSASAEELIGKVVRVADGDTLTIRTAQPLDYRIRINGIDAPEKGQPFRDRSKQNLVLLALNKEAKLDCYKTDQYHRKVCRVYVDGKDVGLEQVRVGAAWWYRAYAKEQTRQERSDYEQAETEARSAGVGLWRDREPVPPWEWRRAKAKK